MTFARREDMAGDAQGRVISQYIESPLFMALIGELGDQVQQVEDALWALYQAVFLSSATDVWLDYLGAIVGEAREGWGDTDYRRFIQARILANRSSGTINEVLTIVALVLGTDVTLSFDSADEYYPASMLIIVVLDNNPSAALRTRMCAIAARARPTGVRLLINTTPNDDNFFQVSDSSNGVLPTPTIEDVTMQDTVGGSLLDDTTFGYRLVAKNAAGKTLASLEVFGATDPGGTDTNQLLISWPAVTGATGYEVYGRDQFGEMLRLAVVGVVTSWIDDGSITPSGALPTENTTYVAEFDTLLGLGDSSDPDVGGQMASGDLA